MKLVIDNVTKQFGNFSAVDGISMEMENGVHGLLGLNGAGKTTLMRMICTILRPTDGNIRYNGKDVFKMDSAYRSLIGYLPQEFGFYPDFTVLEYLMYISSLKGLKTVFAKKKAEQLVEMVGLSREKTKKMKHLSGGMKRRTGIAQTMLNDPEILILDEPTSGLDPMERIRFRNLMENLAEDRIILLSTHIVSDIERIAGKVYIMKEGKLEASGSVKELCANVEGNTLEDVFISYFGENGDEINAQI